MWKVLLNLLFCTVASAQVYWYTTELKSFALNRPYSFNLLVSSNSGIARYHLQSGTLPPGINLDGGGLLSGTPTALGTFQFTLRATNAQGATADQPFSARVNSAPTQLSFSPLSFPAGTVGDGYRSEIAINGAEGPYLAALASGSLPPGIIMIPHGDYRLELIGTPFLRGVFPFTLRVTDSYDQVYNLPYSITISGAKLTILPDFLPPASLNVDYSVQLTGSGGVAPYRFEIANFGTNDYRVSPSGLLQTYQIKTGPVPIAIRVTDALGATIVQQYTLLVQIGKMELYRSEAPNAIAFEPYEYALEIIGGLSPFRCSSGGAAYPSGLSIGSNCKLSGTPQQAGSYRIPVVVADSSGQQETLTLNLTVQALPLTVQSDDPLFFERENDSTVFRARGGKPPYLFSVVGGALPVGLRLLTNGQVAGNPRQVEHQSFTVEVTDSLGASLVKELTIQTRIISWPFASLIYPQPVLGESYYFYMGSGRPEELVAPVTVTLVSGQLPPGLRLSDNGLLQGIPTAVGEYSFRLQLQDARGVRQEMPLNLAVAANALRVVDFYSNAQVGKPYLNYITTHGGKAPYEYTMLPAGFFPAGLSLGSDGKISGTPTGAAATYYFQLRVRDALGRSTIATPMIQVASASTATRLATEDPGPRFLIDDTNSETGHLKAARRGQAYSDTVSIRDAFRYSLAEGVPMPPGLSLSSSGGISGTPSRTGVFSFRVIGQTSASFSTPRTFTILIGNDGPLPLGSPRLSAAQRDTPTVKLLELSGGTPPYRGQWISGNIPLGLEFVTDANGALTLSGMPSKSGSFSAMARVTDRNGLTNLIPMELDVLSWAISGYPGWSANWRGSVEKGVVGQAFHMQRSPAYGTPPYVYRFEYGDPVPGLSLDRNGELKGIPLVAGDYQFYAIITDSRGNMAMTSYLVNIAATAGAMGNVTTFPSIETLYRPYYRDLGVGGGAPPYQIEILRGSLPMGLEFLSRGAISGPLLVPGNFSATVRIRDGIGQMLDREVEVKVPKPTRLNPARTFTAYNARIPLSGWRSPSEFRVSLDSLGQLPEGMRLLPDGTLVGTPLSSGEYTFVVTAVDAGGNDSMLSFILPVESSSTLTFVRKSLPGASVGAAYSQPLPVKGAIGTLRYGLRAGSLPPGLDLSTTGVLSGTPEQSGLWIVLVQAKDSNGAEVTHQVEIVIAPKGYPQVAALLSAASYEGETIAPGEVVVGFGSGLGPTSIQTFALDAKNLVPTTLGGTRVLVDGVAAPLLYTLAGQLSWIAPWNPDLVTERTIAIERDGKQSAPYRLVTQPAKPALFTVDSSGAGQAAALNENGSLNGATNAVRRGSILVLYLTGAGDVDPHGVPGAVAPGVGQLRLPVSVTIGGVPAEIVYAGHAPGLIEGVTQINAKIPAATPFGVQEIRVKVDRYESPAKVTVAVQ